MRSDPNPGESDGTGDGESPIVRAVPRDPVVSSFVARLLLLYQTTRQLSNYLNRGL